MRVALRKSTNWTLNWKNPAQIGTGDHPLAVVMAGVVLQLLWSPLWISAHCFRVPHPPSPSQGRLKHWLHELWTYFSCLYLCTSRYKSYISLSFRKKEGLVYSFHKLSHIESQLIGKWGSASAMKISWSPNMCLLKGLLSGVSGTLMSLRFYSKNNLVLLEG